MACLKPLTAAPRSEPIERRRLVPNITKAIARMTSSIFESNMSLLRVHGNRNVRAPMIRQRDYDIGQQAADACSVAFEIPRENQLSSQNSYRPVVGQRHLHVGPEYAAATRVECCARAAATRTSKQAAALLRRRGGREARP